MIRRDPRRDPRNAQRPESLREALLRDRLRDDGRPNLDGPRRDPYAAYDPGPRTGLVVALVVMQVLAIAFGLLTVSFWQATAPEVALPAQARGLAALTEINALIALRTADLQRQIDAGTDAITLGGFPVHDITVERSAATDAESALDPAAYRTALLENSANAIYERGVEALRAPDAAPSDRLIEGFIGALTRHRHSQAAVALESMFALIVVLGVLLLLATRGRRAAVFALSLAAGGALALVLTLVARGALAVLDTPPGAALTEYASLARTLLSIPTWNALIVLGLGAALALPGFVEKRRG